MTNKDFNRRIYTPQTFRRDIAEVFTHMDELRDAHRSGRVSKVFSERIMLAVTNVNQCRYCSYGHTRAALAAGVPEEQIRNLMAGEFDKLPKDEVVALTFAQHYAESGGNPDPEALSRLVDTYGEATAQDILAYIRMITIGNLSGNTLDAFLSRLKFNPAPGSSLTQELGVLLGAFVIIPIEFFKAKTNSRKKTLSSV
ncbi:MAG: carboxymuconolactone decarboxylase family protein [Chloroflexota bacterium]|nr:carboxymuconolactone decarboxylase family protein [Chloroflexota bacterium]